jgi:hypothetical protein
VSSRGTDFFISHAGRDTGWAEWLAWQLQQAGYTVELDVWDWAPGEDFVARMSAALESADRLLDPGRLQSRNSWSDLPERDGDHAACRSGAMSWGRSA